MAVAKSETSCHDSSLSGSVLAQSRQQDIWNHPVFPIGFSVCAIPTAGYPESSRFYYRVQCLRNPDSRMSGNKLFLLSGIEGRRMAYGVTWCPIVFWMFHIGLQFTGHTGYKTPIVQASIKRSHIQGYCSRVDESMIQKKFFA